MERNDRMLQNGEGGAENCSQKLMWALAVLVGALGIAASGGSLPPELHALLPLAALAVPGLTASVISLLLYQNAASAAPMALATAGEALPMLPEAVRELLPESAIGSNAGLLPAGL